MMNFSLADQIPDRSNVILFSFIIVAILLGFIGVLILTARRKSPTIMFILLIPYIFIGGNLALISVYLIDPIAAYFSLLLGPAISISTVSFVIGIFVFAISKYREKEEE